MGRVTGTGDYGLRKNASFFLGKNLDTSLFIFIFIYTYIYIYIYINRYEKKTQYHFIPICGLDLLKHRSSCQF